MTANAELREKHLLCVRLSHSRFTQLSCSFPENCCILCAEKNKTRTEKGSIFSIFSSPSIFFWVDFSCFVALRFFGATFNASEVQSTHFGLRLDNDRNRLIWFRIFGVGGRCVEIVVSLFIRRAIVGLFLSKESLTTLPTFFLASDDWAGQNGHSSEKACRSTFASLRSTKRIKLNANYVR